MSVLGAKQLSKEIRKSRAGKPDGIAIVPMPDLTAVERSGEASITLRLGRWFLSLRQSNDSHLPATADGDANEGKFSKSSFIPFGQAFFLHPNRFVLASTLEWIRLPPEFAALVVGKSTLGRRGIIIETAAGVHPGFSGCLTLEIANVGEMPVRLVAGMMICQLFFHPVQGELSSTDTLLSGQRKPRLGALKVDPVLKALQSS